MLLGQKGKGSAGEYKVLIFVDNYRGISSRSRPPEEEIQRNDDNVEPAQNINKQTSGGKKSEKESTPNHTKFGLVVN